MGKGIFKKISIGFLAAVLLAVGVPAVSAFEGHVVDLRAHVEQPPYITKTARLATTNEIASAENMGINFPNTPNPATVTQWNNIPEKTCVAWVVTITVFNPTGKTMDMVEVDDNFPAELAIAELNVSPSSSVNITQGPNQYRVHDWVLYNFAPGATATLNLIVWTQLNPAGIQEFTSTGSYWLNQSGATMKWYTWEQKNGPDKYWYWQTEGSYSTGSVLPITVY